MIPLYKKFDLFFSGTIGNQLEELRYNPQQSQIYSSNPCYE